MAESAAAWLLPSTEAEGRAPAGADIHAGWLTTAPVNALNIKSYSMFHLYKLMLPAADAEDEPTEVITVMALNKPAAI